jgi:hypothetical protein
MDISHIFRKNPSELHMKHSGRLGDIVYALPLVKIVSETCGVPVNFYILNDQVIDVKKSVFHPGMGLKVNQALYDYIEPLLSNLTYIKQVKYCPTSELPKNCIDLDSFNSMDMNLMASGNQVWYRKAFGIPVPIEKPWLELKDPPENTPRFDVIVNKSTRFFNQRINYEFLNEFDNVGFVGLDVEFQDFKARNHLSRIEHIPTQSSLDFAHLIQKSSMYLGNQSLGFAIAEGIKGPRAVEIYEPVPVVIPIGGYCIEYINTNQVQSFLENFFNRSFSKKYLDHSGGYVESILDPKKIKLKRRILKALGFKKYQSL